LLCGRHLILRLLAPDSVTLPPTIGSPGKG
jgi:hypothetical protein